MKLKLAMEPPIAKTEDNKEVFTKKHPIDDETEPLPEDTAITIPAPRPSVPPGVTMTRSGRIIKDLTVNV